MKIAFKKDIYRIDKDAAEKWSLDNETLINRAATAAFHWIEDSWPDFREKKIVILCGKGKNGLDGLRLAELLKASGARVFVLNFSDNPHLMEWSELIASVNYVIDAIYGIGFRDLPPPEIQKVIDVVNDSGKPILSLDLPSGVYADGGCCERPIRATWTLSFALPKWGCIDGPGMNYCGKLSLDGLGLGPELINDPSMELELLESKDLAILGVKRPRDSHKGSYGHLLVIGGNRGNFLQAQGRMVGAPAFNALAALRSGAGLVTIAADTQLIPSLEVLVPEALFLPLEPGDPETSIKTLKKYIEQKKISVVLAGGGFGQGDFEHAILKYLVSSIGPQKLILDADGLNLLAQSFQVDLSQKQVLLTPHLAEAARLLGTDALSVKKDKIKALRALAQKYGVTVILKDSVSLIGGSSGVIKVNNMGTPALAKGGSGDVLAGICGALALTMPLELAGSLASGVFGLLGELVESQSNQRAPLVRDLIDALRRISY